MRFSLRSVSWSRSLSVPSASTRRTRPGPIAGNAASSPRSRRGSLRMTPAGRSPSFPSAKRLASMSLPSALAFDSVTRRLDVWRYVRLAGLEPSAGDRLSVRLRARDSRIASAMKSWRSRSIGQLHPMMRQAMRRARIVFLGGWVLLLPPSTWHWKNCEVDWDYAAPLTKWVPTSEVFATREECEARYAEITKREAAHKAGALAHAHALEDNSVLAPIGRLLFDASTSAVCKAMADEGAHSRCAYLEDRTVTTRPPPAPQ